MQAVEALRLVAMLVAAYPASKLPEETQRLYARLFEQLDYDVACEVLREIIESPREFVPPSGLIVTKVRERTGIAERDRQFALPRKYEPGEVRYSPKGRRFVADANDDLRLVRPDEI